MTATVCVCVCEREREREREKERERERKRELVVGVNELQYSVLTYTSQTLRKNFSVCVCDLAAHRAKKKGINKDTTGIALLTDRHKCTQAQRHRHRRAHSSRLLWTGTCVCLRVRMMHTHTHTYMRTRKNTCRESSHERGVPFTNSPPPRSPKFACGRESARVRECVRMGAGGQA
jgi:hypothetical protein